MTLQASGPGARKDAAPRLSSVERNGGIPVMDLLRFTTAGSVDDGKSTLIGRLLYDTKSIFRDQLEAVERVSRQRGDGHVNLALLTDGLRAEREQNITIDVAYRYFATPKRKFIIADTPGHIQYTRNMVTGASTAELAIVLVDARKGVVTQSKRHGFLASLLGIPHVLVAINKMDLVGFSEDIYRQIVREYTEFAEKLPAKGITFIPISALHGDNIVTRSERTPWYDGATLLHHLETVKVGASRNLIDFRFPVQYVIRPHQDYRGYAGRVASGTIRPGEEVVILPSLQTTRIRSIETYGGRVAEAVATDSVILTIEDERDVSRGDMIVRKNNLPQVARQIDATVCWMNEEPLNPDREYLLMHTTQTVRARVEQVAYRIDVDTLHREDVSTLGLNDIGRLSLVTGSPISFDPYQINAQTGSFVLIDPTTSVTVAGGMIRGMAREQADQRALQSGYARRTSPNTVLEDLNISREERERRNGHRAAVVWFTGLSGAGKTTIGREVEKRLHERGCQTIILDGDHLRHGLCGDLGFTPAHRAENVRRVGEVARLFFENGSIVLCTFVSPFRADRQRVRELFPRDRFFEVHVDCGLDELRRRDPKGLYRAAESGDLTGLTGVDDPYEPPLAPDIRLRTDEGVTPTELADLLLLRMPLL